MSIKSVWIWLTGILRENCKSPLAAVTVIDNDNDNDNDNEVYSYPGLQACEIYTCTNIKLKIYKTKYTTIIRFDTVTLSDSANCRTITLLLI